MTRPCESPHEEAVATAKQQVVNAFFNANPARIVERHPLLSVTAAASASLAVTVIAHAPLSRRLATASVVTAVKSAMPILQAFAMKKMTEAVRAPEAPHAVG